MPFLIFQSCNVHRLLRFLALRGMALNWALLHTRDQVIISQERRSPVISIVTVICLIFSSLAIIGRVFTRIVNTHTIGLGEVLTFSAYVRGDSERPQSAMLSQEAHSN